MALYCYKGQSTHYDLSEYGILTNLKTGKVLKGQINQHGYKTYQIRLEDGTPKRLTLHCMLMTTFKSCENMENLVINHIDGNKLNNSLNNLEWCTQKENVIHAYSIGLNPNIQPIYAFDENFELVKSWPSLSQLHRETNYNYGLIARDCKEKKRSKIHGYYWNTEPYFNFEIKTFPNTGIARPVKQLDKDGNLIAIYKSRGEAARALGVNGGHITECCQHRLKSYKGYIWEYLE